MTAHLATVSDTLHPVLEALADESRLRIVGMLARGERCVCALQDDLGVGQSSLPFHLRILSEAGLATDRREGRWVYYALDPEGAAKLEGFRLPGGPGARRRRGPLPPRPSPLRLNRARPCDTD